MAWSKVSLSGCSFQTAHCAGIEGNDEKGRNDETEMMFQDPEIGKIDDGIESEAHESSRSTVVSGCPAEYVL